MIGIWMRDHAKAFNMLVKCHFNLKCWLITLPQTWELPWKEFKCNQDHPMMLIDSDFLSISYLHDINMPVILNFSM